MNKGTTFVKKRPSAANASNKNLEAVPEDIGGRDKLKAKFWQRQRCDGKLEDWVVDLFDSAKGRDEKTAIINSVVHKPPGKTQYVLDTENPVFKDMFFKIVLRVFGVRKGIFGHDVIDHDHVY